MVIRSLQAPVYVGMLQCLICVEIATRRPTYERAGAVKESRYNIWVEHDGAHYVYNGMSGGLLRVPKDEHAALRAVLDGNNPELAETCPATLVADMAKGRMLIGDRLDELDLLQRRYEASRYNTEHFALTIVTSLGCNF